MMASSEQQFYIIDTRPEWRKHRYITLWRPNDAGYCWPLPWAGKYDLKNVAAGGGYYAAQVYEGEEWIRFPVACEAVEALATEQPRPGDIDGDIGPILRNLAPIRAKLLKAACLPASATASP